MLCQQFYLPCGPQNEYAKSGTLYILITTPTRVHPLKETREGKRMTRRKDLTIWITRGLVAGINIQVSFEQLRTLHIWR